MANLVRHNFIKEEMAVCAVASCIAPKIATVEALWSQRSRCLFSVRRICGTAAIIDSWPMRRSVAATAIRVTIWGGGGGMPTKGHSHDFATRLAGYSPVSESRILSVWRESVTVYLEDLVASLLVGRIIGIICCLACRRNGQGLLTVRASVGRNIRPSLTAR